MNSREPQKVGHILTKFGCWSHTRKHISTFLCCTSNATCDMCAMTFGIICLITPRCNVLHHLARLQLDQVVWNRLVTVAKEAMLQRQVFPS